MKPNTVRVNTFQKICRCLDYCHTKPHLKHAAWKGPTLKQTEPGFFFVCFFYTTEATGGAGGGGDGRFAGNSELLDLRHPLRDDGADETTALVSRSALATINEPL